MGAMKSLGTLNACKNRLTKIPLELAASTSITELFLSDNYLLEIPAKIMGMQSLKVFEAERKLFFKKKLSIQFFLPLYLLSSRMNKI